MLSNETLLRRLERPVGPVDVVLDTDAYNEVDDQYAIAYLLRSAPDISTKAIYSAPFLNEKSTSPEDGMLKSHAEILKVSSLCGRDDLHEFTFKGSNRFLPDEKTPVVSAAAEDLVKRAMARPDDSPLYVLAIGAITNIASALLLEPAIAGRIVIVWLGGNSVDWPDNLEFNMTQDVAAARIVFGSGAPIVQLPCQGVVTHLTVTKPELEHWLVGKNPLCDHLAGYTISETESYAHGKPWSRVIWDIATVAWLRSDQFTCSRLMPIPVPEYDHRYGLSPDGHLYRYVYYVNRDAIFEDLFGLLTRR